MEEKWVHIKSDHSHIDLLRLLWGRISWVECGFLHSIVWERVNSDLGLLTMTRWVIQAFTFSAMALWWSALLFLTCIRTWGPLMRKTIHLAWNQLSTNSNWKHISATVVIVDIVADQRTQQWNHFLSTPFLRGEIANEVAHRSALESSLTCSVSDKQVGVMYFTLSMYTLFRWHG